jgi:uncharacterized protein YndB with AHSA1/START domain
MRAAAEIRLAHPPEAAWPLVADPRNWKKWLGERIEAKLISEGPVGVGTTYSYRFHMLGRAFQGRGRVTTYRPYETFAAENRVGAIVLDERIDLRPAEADTVVTYTIELLPANRLLRRLARLTGSLGAVSTRRSVERELVALRVAIDVENQPHDPTPASGRFDSTGPSAEGE